VEKAVGWWLVTAFLPKDPSTTLRAQIAVPEPFDYAQDKRSRWVEGLRAQIAVPERSGALSPSTTLRINAVVGSKGSGMVRLRTRLPPRSRSI